MFGSYTHQHCDLFASIKNIFEHALAIFERDPSQVVSVEIDQIEQCRPALRALPIEDADVIVVATDVPRAERIVVPDDWKRRPGELLIAFACFLKEILFAGSKTEHGFVPVERSGGPGRELRIPPFRTTNLRLTVELYEPLNRKVEIVDFSGEFIWKYCGN